MNFDDCPPGPGYGVYPGPLNKSVLFLYKTHRALSIFKNPKDYDYVMSVKRGDRALWKYLKDNPLGERVKQIVDHAGFGGILACGYRHIDRALITALVERWRPETHTFHLPVGETTITLEDINVLWGLPVDGSVICGTESWMTENDAVDLCQTLQGFTPQSSEFKGKKIKSSSIIRELEKPFSETETTDEQCITRARLIIFYLIGCTLYPDQSNNFIALHFLKFLIDITLCSQYSWGSAVLACLYRNLCDATSRDSTSITGPLFILQIWAWERICSISPKPDERINYNMPLGARWQHGTPNFSSSPSHCLRAYRSQLQSLHESMFTWTPYNGVVESLPDICRSGREIWRSACPLIFWEIVEHHYPQRVMRQFGLVQAVPPSIPLDSVVHENLHKSDRTGKVGRNWVNYLVKYVGEWGNRKHTVVSGVPITTHSITNDYMRWYMDITVIYLSNPRLQPVPHAGFQDDGARLQMMGETMSAIYQSSSQFAGISDPTVMHNLQTINNVAYWAMGMMSYEHGHLLHPSHLTTNPVDLSTPAQHESLGRQCGRQHDGGSGFEGGGTSGLNDIQPGTSFNTDFGGGSGFKNIQSNFTVGINEEVGTYGVHNMQDDVPINATSPNQSSLGHHARFENIEPTEPLNLRLDLKINDPPIDEDELPLSPDEIQTQQPITTSNRPTRTLNFLNLFGL